MIVHNITFYQKHVQAGVRGTPLLNVFGGSTDGARIYVGTDCISISLYLGMCKYVPEYTPQNGAPFWGHTDGHWIRTPDP